MLTQLLIRLCEFIYVISGKLITFHTRPLFVTSQNGQASRKKSVPLVGIIIQGQLLYKNDFSLNTARLYQKIFPGQLIILSTWKGEDSRTLELIRNLENVTVIENDKPSIAGNQNINYQIVSSTAGVKLAKKHGCLYVLKTRSDQRIYASKTIEFFLSLMKQFPIKKGLHQNKRIIATSLYSFKYRLYSISDMCLFGEVDDMLKYMSPAFDLRTIVPDYRNLKELSKLTLGEMYFSTQFLKKCGHKLKWTLADSWDTYTQRFCICDKESIDLFWYKYDMFREYKFTNYESEKNSALINFREWLLLYNNKLERSVPEKTLLLGFKDIVSS